MPESVTGIRPLSALLPSGAGLNTVRERPAPRRRGDAVKDVVRTEEAPAPFQGARYSKAIRAGGFVFVPGQVALRPGHGDLVGETIEEQTEQVFANPRVILEAAGSSLEQIVKTTVFLADFADFSADRAPPAGDPGDVLVLSADGKGIVMRPDALREPTAKAAADEQHKLKTRLSRGEKRHRTRMATVTSVYEATPAPRTPTDVLARNHQPDDEPDREPVPAPVAKHKWLAASVEHDAATVIAACFDEAERRDPDHVRTWVALVDGNTHQIDRLAAEAAKRGITLSILVDFVHVLEYIWQAAWCFHDEGDAAAEAWVGDQLSDILAGDARKVAARLRAKATRARLTPKARKNVDTAATYLINKAAYLDYPTALAAGWPIATGVIEGACRHLIKDRMDLTGARWGLTGAETVLKLRALRTNGDFDNYWHYHLAREQQRLGHHQADVLVAPGAGQLNAFQRGVIPDPVGRLAGRAGDDQAVGAVLDDVDDVGECGAPRLRRAPGAAALQHHRTPLAVEGRAGRGERRAGLNHEHRREDRRAFRCRDPRGDRRGPRAVEWLARLAGMVVAPGLLRCRSRSACPHASPR